MARGLRHIGRLLEVGLWAVGLLFSARLYTQYRTERQYRQPSDAAIICEKCGESQRVDDFLDPAITCTCVASDCRDSPAE